MKILLKLPKLQENENTQKSTSYYNTIESNICSLMTTILNSSIYSLFLMSIVLERSPDSNKLIVPRILEKITGDLANH